MHALLIQLHFAARSPRCLILPHLIVFSVTASACASGGGTASAAASGVATNTAVVGDSLLPSAPPAPWCTPTAADLSPDAAVDRATHKSLLQSDTLAKGAPPVFTAE